MFPLKLATLALICYVGCHFDKKCVIMPSPVYDIASNCSFHDFAKHFSYLVIIWHSEKTVSISWPTWGTRKPHHSPICPTCHINELCYHLPQGSMCDQLSHFWSCCHDDEWLRERFRRKKPSLVKKEKEQSWF